MSRYRSCPPAHTAFLALGALTGAAHAAPVTYSIGSFSDTFHATVAVEPSDDVFKSGSISVFDTRSGTRLIQVQSSELAFDPRNGVAPANIKELPYGEQSLLMYDDFNFDGQKDLAIMDGQNSCYHGPSFRIFLRKGRGFSESEDFTRLAHEFCGMFRVDAAKRQLATMMKNGCCSHQFNTYTVKNDAPALIKSIEEDSAFANAYLRVTTKAAKRVSTEYRLLPSEDSGIAPLVGFDLEGDVQKRVELFAVDGMLDYALVVGPERRVEFSYHLDVLGARSGRELATTPTFVYDPAKHELAFRNGAYRYVIFDRPDKLGVAVHTPERDVFLQGAPKSRTGDLGALELGQYANVLAKDGSATPK